MLENPTSVTFIYSSFNLRKSVGWTEPIPLNTNCDKPIPILLLYVNPSNTPKLWVIDVNEIGCCTTPSKPIIVLVSCFLIDNLCLLPEPVPVNVTATPVATYSGLVYNSNLFSSRTFAYTVSGNIVVTTPEILAVAPIDTAVPAIPINVESGVYVSSSFVLKKWLAISITLVVVLNVPTGLKSLE